MGPGGATLEGVGMMRGGATEVSVELITTMEGETTSADVGAKNASRTLVGPATVDTQTMMMSMMTTGAAMRMPGAVARSRRLVPATSRRIAATRKGPRTKMEMEEGPIKRSQSTTIGGTGTKGGPDITQMEQSRRDAEIPVFSRILAPRPTSMERVASRAGVMVAPMAIEKTMQM